MESYQNDIMTREFHKHKQKSQTNPWHQEEGFMFMQSSNPNITQRNDYQTGKKTKHKITKHNLKK